MRRVRRMASRIGQFLPRRRWARWTLTAVVTGAVLWLVLPRLAAPYVRAKLQATVRFGTATKKTRAAAGHVLSQQPLPGVAAAPGLTVHLVVAR